MTLSNWITLSRIGLIFVIGWLFYIPWPKAKILALIVYILTSSTDWLDGYVARKYHQVTDWGKLMDALVDKIFTISMFILLIGKGLIPTWGVFCILLILCREFFITGLRILLAKSGVVLAAEAHGKIKTILQLVVIGSFFLIEMLRVNISADWMQSLLPVLRWINTVNFILATALTLHSGIHYYSKYSAYLH